MRIRLRKIILCVILFMCSDQAAHAGTQGHYYPGVMGIRDIILPPKGYYALFYDPIYYSNDFSNANGNSLHNYSASTSETKAINVRGHQIPVSITAGVSADIDTSMMFTMQDLLLMWSTGWKFLGADYGAMIVPSMGYVDVDINVKADANATISVGSLSKTVSKDGSVNIESSMYGFGDMLTVPVMLDWRGKNYDVGLYYGFYAPTGAYSEDRIANVGMGFWTQQFQAFGAYYFDAERKTAATVVATYNLNSKIYDKDLTPGQSMTLEYGLGHYVNDRVEIGAYGYHQWQISADAGSAAKQKNVLYQIHGIGGQISGWIIKDKLNITGKCIAEYYGVDRYRGVLGTVNVIWVF